MAAKIYNVLLHDSIQPEIEKILWKNQKESLHNLRDSAISPRHQMGIGK